MVYEDLSLINMVFFTLFYGINKKKDELKILFFILKRQDFIKKTS
jgi:hypothetical protein